MRDETDKALILIVDDIPANVDVLIDTLSYSGFNISIAMSGEEALNQVEEVAPDIILLDILMPGINGFETCRRLKEIEAAREIPVLFMTALSETENKIKGFQAGGVDYITKPFQHEEVLARITAHLTIRQQQRQLRELNASKDTFFSIIAHDLKSSVTSFISFVDLVENFENITPEQFKSYTGLFRKSAENLFELLKNLLTWSRMQHGMIEYAPQLLELHSLAVNNISLLAPTARQKNIGIQHTIPKELTVYGDLHMIDTVLRNLLANAIKFTEQGGTICLSAELDGEMVKIAVADSGIGIPEEKIDLLFNIATKYKRRGTAGEKGTGLGLILCKEFVEKNGGDIWVESQDGEGTTFLFTLPKSSS